MTWMLDGGSDWGVLPIPLPNACLYNPQEGKFGVPIALFEADLRFPTTDFFNSIIREYEFSVRELTPIVVNKIVGFELLCRALGHLSTIPAFKQFFNTSTQSGTRTLSNKILFGVDKELADTLQNSWPSGGLVGRCMNSSLRK
ncbi:unnamed protein product [Lactuca saligna]|uniref:Transposase (putative) gypsy type domain-containing protein n=1 Tax=Lactuca saligna TaxID=75948 RepID=A0AA36EK83_LACSI|nr:unnamed protein product [Lactuca saligna]